MAVIRSQAHQLELQADAYIESNRQISKQTRKTAFALQLERLGAEANAAGHRFKLNRDLAGYHSSRANHVDVDRCAAAPCMARAAVILSLLEADQRHAPSPACCAANANLF